VDSILFPRIDPERSSARHRAACCVAASMFSLRVHDDEGLVWCFATVAVGEFRTRDLGRTPTVVV
jgi:hypothetical protein